MYMEQGLYKELSRFAFRTGVLYIGLFMAPLIATILDKGIPSLLLVLFGVSFALIMVWDVHHTIKPFFGESSTFRLMRKTFFGGFKTLKRQ